MKKRYIFAFIFASLGGTALHFLYDLLPNPLTALISPINESVWEHLKLQFWPTLVASLVLAGRRESKDNSFWGGFFIGIFLMPLVTIGGFYGLKSFGVEGLLVDLALYYLSMAIGFWAAYHTAKSPAVGRAAPYLLLPVVFYGAGLILFTFCAPNLPVFRSMVA